MASCSVSRGRLIRPRHRYGPFPAFQPITGIQLSPSLETNLPAHFYLAFENHPFGLAAGLSETRQLEQRIQADKISIYFYLLICHIHRLFFL